MKCRGKHEIFHVVLRFPCQISCYIAESRYLLGPCMFDPVFITQTLHVMKSPGFPNKLPVSKEEEQLFKIKELLLLCNFQLGSGKYRRRSILRQIKCKCTNFTLNAAKRNSNQIKCLLKCCNSVIYFLQNFWGYIDIIYFFGGGSCH